MSEEPVLPSRRPWWIWPAVIGVALLIPLTVLVVTLVDTGQRTVDNAAVATAIQKERARTIRAACVSTNARHENTIKAMETLVEHQPPEKQAEARKGSEQFVLIIDALVPVRDCEELVRATVNTGGP